jgi:hypothetical protein
VFTILRHVSRSGMQREIGVAIPSVDQRSCDCHTWPATAPHYIGTPRVDFLHPNYKVAKVTGYPLGKHDGIKIGGCGMDMGFQLVYQLSRALYPEYACLGKGTCPSNYHVNHHDQIRCEGTRVHNPDGPDRGSFCYKPDRYVPVVKTKHHSSVPPDWPRLPNIDIGEGQTVPGGYAACITDENGEHPIICPTCKGQGWIPNPAGPERFDLVHTDGYALKQRWL